MDLERSLQRLHDYRTRSERFDRLAGAVMSNRIAARALKSSVAAAVSGARFVGRKRAASRAASRAAGRSASETAPPTVFFIVGQARSGTTWLRGTLGAHPEILCRGEGRFFERSFAREDLRQSSPKHITPVSLYGAVMGSRDLRLWAERSVWAEGKDAEEHLNNLARLAIDYFLAYQLAGTGKRIVGDKTPFVSPEFVGEIARVYPEARVVHIIRDGRDVAVSRVHHMWNHAKSEGGIYALDPEELRKRDAFREGTLGDESLFTRERLAGLATTWSSGVARVMHEGPALLGDNYLEVRYEDLLQGPVEGIQRVLRFLGARADEGVARGCVEKASFERGSNRKRGEEDPSSHYRKGVAGDWKNAFTAGDTRVFGENAGELLARLGYEEAFERQKTGGG